jgi:hypothetical protein
MSRIAVAAALLPMMTAQNAFAWGRDGHQMINQLAAAALPASVPDFLRDKAALEEMAYLGPEPDRWKQRDAEPELVATQSPDHFIDMEWAEDAAEACDGGKDCVAGYRLPRLRYDFIRALAKAQAEHPDLKLTPEGVGMLPWQVEEVWERLKSSMRNYRELREQHKETKPVEEAILFYAGWLGHYVADGSQPLHTTIQYNGWTGPNPNHYTTEHHIHSQFESVYVSANIKAKDVTPLIAASQPHLIDDEWSQFLGYLDHTHSMVEQTYQIEKAGGFEDSGSEQAKTFTDERLAAGAIELRDLIYSAWVHSADPVRQYNGPQ